jgi:hypothetical protein
MSINEANSSLLARDYARKATAVAKRNVKTYFFTKEKSKNKD